jgi:hypothetical protein
MGGDSILSCNGWLGLFGIPILRPIGSGLTDVTVRGLRNRSGRDDLSAGTLKMQDMLDCIMHIDSTELLH